MKLLYFPSALRGRVWRGPSAPRGAKIGTETDVYGYELKQAILREYGYNYFVTRFGVFVKERNTTCVCLDQESSCIVEGGGRMLAQ